MNTQTCVCTRSLTAWESGWHPHLAFSMPDADQMTAGRSLMTERPELDDASLDLAQSCPSETNINYSRALGLSTFYGQFLQENKEIIVPDATAIHKKGD